RGVRVVVVEAMRECPVDEARQRGRRRARGADDRARPAVAIEDAEERSREVFTRARKRQAERVEQAQLDVVDDGGGQRLEAQPGGERRESLGERRHLAVASARALPSETLAREGDVAVSLAAAERHDLAPFEVG